VTRLAIVALVLLVVASAATAVATPAAAQGESFVAIDVEATPDPAEPGTNVTITTTVTNAYEDGSPYKLQRVSLRNVRDSNSTDIDSARPSTTVTSNSSESVDLHEEFDQTGEHQRYVHLKFITSDKRVITVVRPVTVTVEQTHPSMSLSAGNLSPGGDTDLTLTVANGLPETVRGVTVDFESEDLTLAEERRVVSSLETGQSANVSVPATDVEPGTKTIDAHVSYVTAEGESRTVTRTLTTTVDDEQRPAQISLTGIRASQQGDELVIRGSASNVGSTNTSGVLVSVADGDGVGPAQNQASYFVGAVDASDYSSFEVHATLATDGNETISVPLDVAYDVDGERLTRTVAVEYTPENTTAQAAQEQSSGVPVVPAIAGLALLLVGGVVVRRYR